MIVGEGYEPGSIHERYEIVRPLGEGGMAQVFLVRHTELGNLHALKVLRAGLASAHDRLIREGRVQASLSHRNVVAVHDVLPLPGAKGLVMEYVDGPTLSDLIADYQPTLQQADHLARQIMEGVQAAHDLGMIHRDLKPANIILAIDEQTLVPKITDFGLAKLLDDSEPSRTRSGTSMGTPIYMAPEQFRNAKGVDRRADVFALGALLYELVSGTQAFWAPDLIAVFERSSTRGYRPLREVVPQIPVRMERAIEAALDPEADTRIATVSELLALWCDGTPFPVGVWEAPHLELVRAATPSPSDAASDTSDGTSYTLTTPEPQPSPLPQPLPTRTAPAPASHPLPWLFAGAALMGLIGVVVFGLTRSSEDVPSPVSVERPSSQPAPAVRPAPVPDAGEIPLDSWTALGPATFTFGDPGQYVSEHLLAREYNYPGRTIRNENPGFPLLPASPSREIELPAFALTDPLTWADWEALGGTARGPAASPATPQRSEWVAVLNAASTRAGLTPALTEQGTWNGADGLRPPTEAEWEFAATTGGFTPQGLETVIDTEPAPRVPGRGEPRSILRGVDARLRDFSWSERTGSLRLSRSISAQ